jgi:hypothetical protein
MLFKIEDSFNAWGLLLQNFTPGRMRSIGACIVYLCMRWMHIVSSDAKSCLGRSAKRGIPAVLRVWFYRELQGS